MPEYSIFTEFDCKKELREKNKADLNILEEKLREFPQIIKKKRVDNSIIFNYDGDIAQLRPIILESISQIKRQSEMPIYITLNSDEMYFYKK